MNWVEIVFWSCAAIIIYTYLGYGLVMLGLVKTKRVLNGIYTPPGYDEQNLPGVTLIVPAYNEQDHVAQKANNSLNLDYPAEKLRILFVSDGSTDETPEIISGIQGIELLHESARNGKIMAMNRAMKEVDSEIVVFSDANTMLNQQAIREIVKHYSNPKVGCVSGEKRILVEQEDAAAGSGEGAYWKYESALKKLDSEFYSAVGAAGELFSIRTKLYQTVEPDTLLDDFIISLRIAQKGYVIAYEPQAYAMEKPSFNVSEELKRKVRICAGGIQSIVRMRTLLNPFKFGKLSFLFISHRVLRWTITPLSLVLIFLTNAWLSHEQAGIYSAILMGQLGFYALAAIGRILTDIRISIKGIFIPYYFFIMNYAVFLGFFRYLKGNQSVLWDRAKRA